MNRKKILIILGILIGIGTIIGGSYALWRVTLSQTGNNKIATGCLKLELTKEENLINLQNAYPIYDEEGKTLTPYSFTITNTCDMFASYIVQLEMTETSTLPTQYIRAMVNNEQILNLNEYEETKEYVNKDTTEARILTRGALGEGDSEDYTLRLWIDSDVDQFTTDAIGKTLSAKITITAAPSTYSPVENGITTLHDAILANEYQTSNIEVAKEKIAQKQQPDFSKTAPIINWQESSTTIDATLSYIMPDPADIGSGKDYATELTSENVYVGFATNYTFNEEDGKYYLSDFVYQDPTTIDFSNSSYYICSSGTNITSSGIMRPYSNSSCEIMFEITNFNSSEFAQINASNYNYTGIKYSFQTNKRHTQTELESDKSDKGLYSVADDYGTSYYYRGSSKNNYVQFAGHYWRIIRINGDGSIRLLYAGKTKDATDEDLLVGTSTFNTNQTLPLYVGYMYGNPNGTTLEEVNANTNDSTIKVYLDNWYEENLINYSNYIADSGFCNDRTLASYSDNGDGMNTSTSTYYASYERYTTYNPSLMCSDVKRDFFSVSNEFGNHALAYPIGMITIDELMMAGSSNNKLNTLTYTYSNRNYWTMSPNIYNSFAIASSEFLSSGSGSVTSNWVALEAGVRPVINLKADVEITGGIGTQNEPFVVKTA